MALASKLRTAARLHAIEFGMTPAAATKVQGAPEEKRNPFAEMILEQESEDLPHVQ
ncbi:MAG: hypothetical protein WBR26_23710 [Candidatus Acidiferrum sp.]